MSKRLFIEQKLGIQKKGKCSQETRQFRVSFPGSQPTKSATLIGISQIKQRKIIHDVQLFPYRCHSAFLIEIHHFRYQKKG
jgi:hypothetical protein